MSEYEKTIQQLMKRDRKLREAIDQLAYQHKRKNEFTQKTLQHIRVRLASLKWTVQLLSRNADAEDREASGQLRAIAAAAADCLKLTEDLIRTLDDPA